MKPPHALIRVKSKMLLDVLFKRHHLSLWQCCYSNRYPFGSLSILQCAFSLVRWWPNQFPAGLLDRNCVARDRSSQSSPVYEHHVLRWRPWKPGQRRQRISSYLHDCTTWVATINPTVDIIYGVHDKCISQYCGLLALELNHVFCNTVIFAMQLPRLFISQRYRGKESFLSWYGISCFSV